MRLVSPGKVIAAGVYECVFAPLMLATIPRDAELLRWVMAVGVGIGPVAVVAGLLWWRAERRVRRAARRYEGE